MPQVDRRYKTQLEMLWHAEMMMGRKVRMVELRRLEIDGKKIAILFYKVHYAETGWQYRWQIFVDGKPDTGGMI